MLLGPTRACKGSEVPDGRAGPAPASSAISKPASSIAPVIIRYDRVVGWRTVTHRETMDTWMEWVEGVIPRGAASMVRVQLHEEDQYIG